MSVHSLTEDQLQTAAMILCNPERLETHNYSQDQFDFFCETIIELMIAAHEADHPWLADSLQEAERIAEARFLRKGQS